MGLGDEIMVTGEVVRAQRTNPTPIIVLDKHGLPRWHPLWEGNRRIVRAFGTDCRRIVNGSGCRPYIDYAAMKRWAAERGLEWDANDRAIPWQWRADYRAVPGELFLHPNEERFARIVEPIGPFVLVEPRVKADRSNKDWGWGRWESLIGARPDIQWAQVGPHGARKIAGATMIETGDFRQALAVLARAAAFVGTDGALHHAAAALGVPAVVIWGGFTSPRNLGYDAQENLHDGGDPCGARRPCDHCAKAMTAIAPADVSAALDRALASKPAV